MAYLLSWLSTTYTRSRVILLAPLPSVLQRYRQLDAMWAGVAARQAAVNAAADGRPRIVYAPCGALLDPRNKMFFRDGIHPLAAGYRRIFSCLTPTVRRLIQISRAEDAAGGIPP